VPVIRVFIAAPGDVNHVKEWAQAVLTEVADSHFVRRDIKLEPIAWDWPATRVVLSAALKPQSTIRRDLPEPRECDITIALFWNRLGTPLTDDDDGRRYLSGTDWELRNALSDGSQCEARVFIFRLQADWNPTREQFEEKERVDQYFQSDFFVGPDRSLQRGYEIISNEDSFRTLLKRGIEKSVTEVLSKIPPSGTASTPRAPQWHGSPFPGLRTFTKEDAPIFFGRSRDTYDLVKHVRKQPFVVVFGASGCGKSSLVRAGLLARLCPAKASPSDIPWIECVFTPAEEGDPFRSLAAVLKRDPSGFAVGSLEELAATLEGDPAAAANALRQQLPSSKRLLLVVDQLEEIFAMETAPRGPEASLAKRFLLLLQAMARRDAAHVVATVRDDFYDRVNQLDVGSALLRDGSFSLSIPKRDRLREMIERPAELAHIAIPPQLVDRMLDEVGSEPGNLALLAYFLDELYTRAQRRAGLHGAPLCIEDKDYTDLGGVRGAIGERAKTTYNKLKITQEDKEAALSCVFRALVNVDERGVATRRVAKIVTTPRSAEDQLVNALIAARLLTTGQGGTIEVAHEALFREWRGLADWIERRRDDLAAIRAVERDALYWKSHDQKRELLPSAERLANFVDALKALDITRKNVGNDEETLEAVRLYTEPERDRILRELEADDTTDARRAEIGDRLNASIITDPRRGVGLRDDRLPDIDWCPVEGGTFNGEGGGSFEVPSFYIARYPITVAQFGAFRESDDGHSNETWWKDLETHEWPHPGRPQGNYPQTTVTWYDAVAFTRWLSARLLQSKRIGALPTLEGVVPDKILETNGWSIRLPTEWEWQWAAQAGPQQRVYPWGEWEGGRANTIESGVGQAMAVGMYPRGEANCGAADMSGNVWEWCLNKVQGPEVLRVDTSNDERVLRGGSFFYRRDLAACALRRWSHPNLAGDSLGFRVVLSPYPRSL
jgi:energy-coupling factor transporter ATP-binding protein EcfA2